MKKIYWIRRLFLATMIYTAGAASTGKPPTWVKILFVMSVAAYLLLSEEFQFDIKKIETR